MILLIVTILSLLATGFSQDKAIPSCPGSNEYWDEYRCKDNGCENPYDVESCVGGYSPNCFCYPGYVRDYNGLCILIDECPPKPTCPNPNEEWQRCHSGCEGSCTQPSDKVCFGCINGCYCKPGYVRHNGECIAFKRCPNQCGLNEEWYECHGGCEANCEYPDRSPWDCEGCMKGCFCKQGFVRNGYNACVDKGWCDLFYKRSGLRVPRGARRGRRNRRS